MAQKVLASISDKSSPVSPSGYAGGTQVLPSQAIQHAWFELTRTRPWRSVALIAADERTATLSLAMELSQMASLDPRNRVLLLNATGHSDLLGNRPNGGFAAPGGSNAVPAAQGKYWILDCAKMGMDEATAGMVEVPKHTDQLRQGQSAYTMLLIATNALLSSPAAVSAARSADTTVICVTLGHTSFTDAKRCVELVGEENVAGTIAIRPRR
ncbi:MAG: hypothetical protein EOO40_07420 [Deltaproteobacteria bacterium]|nr:MAG: hypothetical protein EOO40_07420 [Deltaproteobacteria bacterium]